MIGKHRTAKQSRHAMASMTVRTSHPLMVSSCVVVAATPVVRRENLHRVLVHVGVVVVVEVEVVREHQTDREGHEEEGKGPRI